MANKLNIQYTSYDLKNLIADRGWILARDYGRHGIYCHPSSREKIAMPRHRGNIPPGTVRQILRQSNV